MSPTVFRDGPYRFFFYSREEPRLHVHVASADGIAKLWLEPTLELASNQGLETSELGKIQELIIRREKEIRDAWHRHFRA